MKELLLSMILKLRMICKFYYLVVLSSVGLTLTNANVAIFLSEYWNESSNLQAEDRLLRIGQKKNVNIINLRVKNSIQKFRRD